MERWWSACVSSRRNLVSLTKLWTLRSWGLVAATSCTVEGCVHSPPSAVSPGTESIPLAVTISQSCPVVWISFNMEFCYFSGLCFLTVKRTKSLMKLCTRNTSWLPRHSNLAHCPQENLEQSKNFNGFFSPRIPKYWVVWGINDNLYTCIVKIKWFMIFQYEEWAFPWDHGEDHHV